MKNSLLIILLCTFISIQSVSAETLSITQSEIDTIINNVPIEGSRDAPITLIEYSDMECPFCIRLHNDIQLWKNVHQKYGNLVNYTFKNNRGVNHTLTEKKALALICMKRTANNQVYIDFYNEVLSNSSGNGLYPLGRIVQFIRKKNIAYSAYQKCIKDPDTLQIFNQETLEAQKYDLSGTPGIIILNTKTKKYITILGAYPIDTFYDAIDELLK